MYYYVFTMEKEIFWVPFCGASGKTVEDYFLESNKWKEGSSVLEAIWNLPSLVYIRHRLEEIFLQNDGIFVPPEKSSPIITQNRKALPPKNAIPTQWRTWIRWNISWHDGVRLKERKNPERQRPDNGK